MKLPVFLFLFPRRTQTHPDPLILQVGLLNPSSGGNYINHSTSFVLRTSCSVLEEESQGFHLGQEALPGPPSCGAGPPVDGAGGGEPCKLPFPREGTLGTVYLLGLFVLPLRIPTARQKEAGGPSFLERDEGDVICVTTGQTTMQQVQEDELEGAFNGAG